MCKRLSAVYKTSEAGDLCRQEEAVFCARLPKEVTHLALQGRMAVS